MALFLPFLLIVLHLPAAGEDVGLYIKQAYTQQMNSYFLGIRNAAAKFPRADQFVHQVFRPESIDDKSAKDLAQAITPKVLTIPDGVMFEFGPGEQLQVKMTGAIGTISIDEVKRKYSWWHELSPMAVAHAWVPLATRLAIGIFRLVVGNSVRATAAGTGAGAVGGCVVGMKTKLDHETMDKACLAGGLDGALLVGGLASIPYLNDRLDLAVSKGAAPSTAAKYIRGLGLLGTIAAVGFSIPTLANMNGSVLRCQGSKGDFIISAKVDGATRHTLYESYGDQLQFYKAKAPGPQVAASANDLDQFLTEVDAFKGLPTDQRRILAQQLLVDRERNRDICRKNGPGYTENRSIGSGERLVEGVEGSPAKPSTSTK